MVKKNDQSVESQGIHIAVISEKIATIESTVKEIKEQLDNHYVTKGEFNTKVSQMEGKYDPAVKIIYGIIALILTGVFGGLLSLVIGK
jgi:hypothetical protein